MFSLYKNSKGHTLYQTFIYLKVRSIRLFRCNGVWEITICRPNTQEHPLWLYCIGSFYLAVTLRTFPFEAFDRSLGQLAMGWKCYRESNDGHIVSIACLWLETYQTDNWESISCLCNSITGFKGRLKYGPSQFIIPYLMIDRVLSPSKRRLISAWICMLSVVCPPTSSASCLTLKHSFMVEIAWLAFGNPAWHQFRLCCRQEW